MDEMIVWLRAQLDDQARSNQLHTSVCSLTLGSISGNVSDECDCGGPDFVLSDVDAKREIMNLAYSKCGADSAYADGWDDAALLAVKLMALPFSGRPGYQESWRP
jgi:hypothetical protein